MRENEGEIDMALIKCPECGKEISDSAVKCPKCGYPLKAENKRREKENKDQKLIECPECHNMVESQFATCPCCGYALKKKPIVVIEKIRNILKSKKGKKILIIGIVLIVIICGFIGYKCTYNEFTQYTKYIGKSYKKLPKGLEHKDLEYEDDTWLASTTKEDTSICSVKGIIYYRYSKMDMSEYGTKADQIYGVEWDADNPDQKDCEEIQDKLVKIYGSYDKKKITDWLDDDYLDVDEKYTEYTWNDEKGMNITLTIHDEDDEDDSIDEVYISWEKAK